MMQTSEQIGQIATALAKAQGEIQNPAKTHTNPHFKTKYADLTDGLDVIRPVLSKHGLAFIQATEVDGDVMTLRTRLMHASGEWIDSVYPVCRVGKHQEMGSALTYSKRYSLFSLIGIAGDDDDDGNSAAEAAGGRSRSREHDTTRLPPRPTATSKAQQDKAAYVEKALAEIADIDSTDRLTVWWNAEAKNRQLHFDANDDPLYHQIKAAAKKRGDVLAETAQEAAE